MIGAWRIFRLGHVEVRVPDLELCAAYYTEVLGLREVEREGKHVYLKGWDEHDHHSVILTEAPRYGLEHVAFKSESIDDLEGYETTLERYGCTVERLAPDDERAMGDAIRFDSPSGHVMEIYAYDGQGRQRPAEVQPAADAHGPGRHRAASARPLPPDDRERPRRRPLHAARRSASASPSSSSATRATSSSSSSSAPGQPHDIAFTRGASGGLHHFAFWLDSWSEIGRAADILRMNGVDIDVGPTRHGITRGHTIYFFDPVGNRNEVFSGGYHVDPDWETITWTEDQFGKALFYYENRIVESFVTIHS